MKQFKNKLKNKKKDFLIYYLVGNILAGKEINRAGEGIVRAGYGNKKVRNTTTKNNKKFQCYRNQNLMVFILEIIYQN